MLGGLPIFLIIIFVCALLGVFGWITHLHLRARRLGLPTPTFSSYFRSPSSSASQSAAYSSSYRNTSGSGGGGGILDKIKSIIPGQKKKQSQRGFGMIGGNNRGGMHDDADAGAWDTRYGYDEEELGLENRDTAQSRSNPHPIPKSVGLNANGGITFSHPSTITPTATTATTPNNHTNSTPTSHNNDYDSDDHDEFHSPPRGRSRSRSPRYSVEDQQRGNFVQPQQKDLNPFSDGNAVPRTGGGRGGGGEDGFGGPVGVRGGLQPGSPTASLHSERRSVFREEAF